jgi:hypothetical protein
MFEKKILHNSLQANLSFINKKTKHPPCKFSGIAENKNPIRQKDVYIFGSTVNNRLPSVLKGVGSLNVFKYKLALHIYEH